MFRFQIRVNSVNPTVVMTALAKRSGWDKPEVGGKMLKRIPLGRFAGNHMRLISIMFLVVTLNSVITPFNAFEISNI